MVCGPFARWSLCLFAVYWQNDRGTRLKEVNPSKRMLQEDIKYPFAWHDIIVWLTWVYGEALNWTTNMKENNLNAATFELREKDLKESFTVQPRCVSDQTSAVEKIILSKNSSFFLQLPYCRLANYSTTITVLPWVSRVSVISHGLMTRFPISRVLGKTHSEMKYVTSLLNENRK